MSDSPDHSASRSELPTRALAVELGSKGIPINTVSPGTIDTPMSQGALEGMNPDEAELPGACESGQCSWSGG